MDTARDNAQLRRHDPDVVAEDLRRIFLSSQAQEVVQVYRESLVRQLETMQDDGTSEFRVREHEVVLTLRILNAMLRIPQVAQDLQQLREQGYAPTEIKPDGA